jgi:hypothetical protein
MLKKLIELWRHIGLKASIVQFILCQLAAGQKAITSPFNRLRGWLWRKDTDSLPDSTLAYSEMPGALDENAKFLRGIHTEEQFEKIRKDL